MLMNVTILTYSKQFSKEMELELSSQGSSRQQQPFFQFPSVPYTIQQQLWYSGHDILNKVDYRVEADQTTTLHLHIKDYARVVIYNQQGRKITDTGMPICDGFGKHLISEGEGERPKIPDNMILRDPRDPRMKTTPRTSIADQEVQTAISFGRRLGHSVRFFNVATLREYDPKSPTTAATSDANVRYVEEPSTSAAKRTSLHNLEEEHCASCASVIAGAYDFAMCPQHGGASALPITNGPVEPRKARNAAPTASTSTAIVEDFNWILDGKNYPKPRSLKMTVRNAHNERVETTSPYRMRRMPLPRRTSIEKFPFPLPEDGTEKYRKIKTDFRHPRQYRRSPPPPPFGESTSERYPMTPYELAFPRGTPRFTPKICTTPEPSWETPSPEKNLTAEQHGEYFEKKNRELGERMMRAHREKTELRQQDKQHLHPPSE
jgi:hypothetical protein